MALNFKEDVKADTPFGQTDPLPPAPATYNRHTLRTAEEYPADEVGLGRFHIPRHEWPDGFALQWCAVEVWGQPQPTMRAESEKKGWVSVHNGEFDGRYDGRFIPTTDRGEIKVDGLVLMARPKTWDDKARGLAVREAQARVNIKVNQLRRGELDGVSLDPQHKTALATNMVNVSAERISIPLPPKT